MIITDPMQRVRNATHSNVFYEMDIDSPRAASRKIRVTFTRNFEDRIGREDGHSRYMLEIADGQYSRLRSADQVKLPKSLEQPLADAVESICAHEHSLAVQAGVLPLDPERLAFYSGHYGRFDVAQTRRADAVLATFDPSIPVTPELIAAVVAVAANFVSNEEHSEKLDAAGEVLEKQKTKYEDLLARSDEAIRAKEDSVWATTAWESAATELLSVETRLQTKDLVGTYGADDFERILDLMQPILDRCRLV